MNAGMVFKTAVISGPTFARELAAGLPKPEWRSHSPMMLTDGLSTLILPPSFRVYTNPDFIGLQRRGLKNVIADSAGLWMERQDSG